MTFIYNDRRILCNKIKSGCGLGQVSRKRDILRTTEADGIRGKTVNELFSGTCSFKFVRKTEEKSAVFFCLLCDRMHTKIAIKR